MTAGAISVPTIVPLRAPIMGQSKATVDTTTRIEIKSETSDVTIYYTLNGSKPEPFQTIGPAAKSTFTYHEPITLPSGKRTVKAVAVSKDGRESFVVAKVFDVEHVPLKESNHRTDGLSFINDIPANEEAKREVRKFANKMMTGKEAWAEIQKMKEAEDSLTGGYGGILSSKRKPPTGPRFLNNRFGNISDRTTNGHDFLDSARMQSEQFSHRSKIPPNDATQAMRLQRETDFMKCIHCFAPRPSDPFARFCNECGNAISPLPQTRLPPPEPGQMGTCVSCNALVPFNTPCCLVCEAPLGPQNVPQASIKLTDRLLCVVCGTTNSPHLKVCVTCGSNLPDGKLLQQQLSTHQSLQSSRSEFGRTTMMTCSKCGRVNSTEARFCDWCGTKPSTVVSTVPLICTKCHGTNSPYAQFCGMCGGVLAAPIRPELRNSVLSGSFPASQSMNGNSDAEWIPVNVYVPPAVSRSDAVTQTVGLFYPSQQKINSKNQEMEDKLIIEKEMRDRKPLLTAISPGRGYWRKQVEHICGHLKAHASNNTDFRALIGEPRMGKLLSATVHEDGFELSLTINFALRANDGSFVGKPTGVTNDLLSSFTTGRRAASITSYPSQESLDSIENTARSSRKNNKKSARKPKPKTVKKDDDSLSEESRKLLKEVGKFGEGQKSEIQQLIEEGANPNCVNKDNIPVLHVAVINKHVDAIPILVQEGADLNGKGPNKGNTVLHEAILMGPSASEVIDVLLGCGASTSKKNDNGETPYDLAVKAGYDSLAKKLTSHIGQSTMDKLVKPKSSRNDL